MKVIIDNIETKEVIIIEEFDCSCSALDLKIQINSQKSYALDSIQLYTLNNHNINDNSSVQNYILIDSNELCLKFKIDKSILKIIIEIYEKLPENLSFNLTYSASIFLLKKLIELKTKIPIEEQLIYLNNSKLSDEDTFFELIFKNFYDRETRSKSVDHNSSTGDLSSPRITKLKLLRKKTNKSIGLDLDFSFNYMKNLQKMNWENRAPSFREIEDGLSMICYCTNKNCYIYNQMFVQNLGKISL